MRTTIATMRALWTATTTMEVRVGMAWILKTFPSWSFFHHMHSFIMCPYA